MNDAPGTNRSVNVSGGAVSNSVLISGDGNTVVVYQMAAAVASAPLDGKNPYVGPLAYTEDDRDRFFGREALVDQVWTRFRDLIEAPPKAAVPRFLAILGPSGSGKSSVVRAGLIPKLADNPVGGRNLRVVVLTPGAHPLDTLAAGLATLSPSKGGSLRKQQEYLEKLNSDDPQAMRHIGAELRVRGPRILLLVDQFEEIYSLCEDEAERKAFVGALLAAASDPGRAISVIVTMRTDFLGNTQADKALNQLVAAQSLIVPAMSTEELRRAIAEPARQAGQPLHESTIERLITWTEGRDGALPLLQFVLVQIFQGGPDDVATMARLGDPGKVLGTRAEEIFHALSEDQQIIAQRAFLAMVRFNENQRPTRNRVALKQLVVTAKAGRPAATLEQVRDVIDRFANPDARLVTLSANADGDTTAEVSHEAIFDNWDTLKTWISDGHDDIEQQDKLRQESAEWARLGRPEGSLSRRPELDLLKAMAAKPTVTLGDLEQEFLNASQTAARRREHIVLAVVSGIAALGVAALAAGALATAQGHTAELQRSRALWEAAQDAVAEGDAGRGLLLALEAAPPDRVDKPGFELPSAELRAALLGLTEVRAFEHLDAKGEPEIVGRSDFAAGDRRIVTSTLNAIFIWDTVSGRQIVKIPGKLRVVASRDGRRLATFGAKGVQVWDASSGTPVSTISGGLATDVAFSPNGERLAVAWNGQRSGIWSAETGAALVLFGEPVTDVAFSSDGRNVVVASSKGRVELLDAATGLPHGPPLLQESYGPLLIVSPAGGTLVVTDQTRMSVLNERLLFNLNTGRLIRRFPYTGPGEFSFGSYSPDGHWFAMSTAEEIEVVDTTTGQVVRSFRDPDGAKWGLRFSPDGAWLASVSDAHTARVWDLNSPDQPYVLTGHSDRLTGATFSMDGRRILTTSADGTARLWKAPADYESLLEATPAREDPQAALRPGPRMIQRSYEAIDVRNAATGQRVWSLHGPAANEVIAMSADAGLLLIAENGLVHVADSAGQPLGDRVRTNVLYPRAAFSTDGARFVIADGNHVALWDVRPRGHPIARVSFDNETSVASVAMTPDGRVVLSVFDGSLRIWDPVKQSVKTRQGLPDHPAYFMRLSPDAKRVVTLDNKNGFIWDLDSDAPPTRFPTDIQNAEFSPDGRLILGSSGKAFEVRDVVTGQLLLRRAPALAAGWGPAGRSIVVVTEHGVRRLSVDLAEGKALGAEACRLKPRDFTNEELSHFLLRHRNPCNSGSAWLSAFMTQ